MHPPRKKQKAPSRRQPVGAKHKNPSSKTGSHAQRPLASSLSQESVQVARGDLSTGIHNGNGCSTALGAPPELPAQRPQSAFAKLAQIIGPWFTVFIGLTLSTGFLCRNFYLAHWGIHENNGELFKATYIHIGILFLLFPVSVLIPLVVTLALRRAQQKNAELWKGKANSPPQYRIPFSSYLLFLNMGWVFYVGVLFTPRNFFFTDKREFVTPLIFVISLTGTRFINWITNKFIVPHHSEFVSRLMRWALCLVTVGILDYFAFRGFWPELWRILWGPKIIPSGAVYYFLLMALIPYVVWQANSRSKQITIPRGRGQMRLAALSLSAMFVLSGAYSFAVRVYPHIPSAKGGGLLTDEPCVKISLKEASGSHSITNDPITMTMMHSNCFVIIHQSNSALFLANTNEASGPAIWKEMRARPEVIRLNKDSVDRIAYSAISKH